MRLCHAQESICIENAAQADCIVAQLRAAGYDGVKIYNHIEPEIFDALIRAGTRYGMNICGHVPIPVGAKHCLQTNMASYEHVRAFPQNCIAEAGQKGVYWTPTLAIEKEDFQNDERLALCLARARRCGLNQGLYQSWKQLFQRYGQIDLRKDRTYEEYRAGIQVFLDNGGNLLAGTDTGVVLVIPGYNLYDELYELTLGGATTYQALCAATIHPARYLGVEDRRGTVEVGKEADLVLLAQNPLEDIRNIGTVKCTMFQGRWYDEDARRKLQQDAQQYVMQAPEVCLE